jgi:hypothetical protein
MGGVGVGVDVGVGVGAIEGDGVAEGVDDADAEAEVVVAVVAAALDAACGALLAAWLLLVDDVQPATDNEAIITSTIIANNFFIIQVPLTEERIKIVQRRRDNLSVSVWLRSTSFCHLCRR